MTAISANTKVTLTIATTLSIMVSVACGTWAIRGYMEEFRAAQVETNRVVSNLSMQFGASRDDAVSQQQIRLFADNMRYENKEMKLIVPDPRQFVLK